MTGFYILDTNVLLHDPNAIYGFPNGQVIVPIGVIEEIDQFKRELSELGRNARQVSRLMDSLRAQGKLCEGVPLREGSSLRIQAAPDGQRPGGAGLSADEQILRLALDLRAQHPNARCVVVTKDINLRLKADALGLDATDYHRDRVDVSELYTGHTEWTVEPAQWETFRSTGALSCDGRSFSPNEYVMLRDAGDAARTALGRFDAERARVVALRPLPKSLEAVRPRNREQYYAMDALLDDRIKLVTLIGKAGTGKTLLAVAAGLYKVLEERAYRRLLVSRPTFPMGRDLGYLPGSVEDKLNPWMQPVYDALDLLADGYLSRFPRRRGRLVDPERVGVEPLTYIRGRSIPHQFIVVDEAQNLTPLEVKTVITRVGPGTKIVLAGDIYQIDNPYVDSTSNGLSTLVEKFRNERLAAHVYLTRGVRSDVAELAANLL